MRSSVDGEAGDLAVLDHHLGGGGGGADVDAHGLDALAEDGCGPLVELDRHQPGCELDDGGAEAQRAQGVGGLQPEQAAADHHAGAAAGRPHADGVEVVDGPVDEGPGVGPRDRGHERHRPGGEDEGVVVDALAAGGDDVRPQGGAATARRVDGQPRRVVEPGGTRLRSSALRPSTY